MKALLDTCTFLWLTLEPRRLSALAAALIVNPANRFFLSAASVWEISVKYSRGHLSLLDPPDVFVPVQRTKHGIDFLPLCEAAALHEPKLPRPHRDPFDRMLVCQAITHGLTILTPDPLIQQYPVSTAW